MPGLNEKFTGPITPKSPDKPFASPVMVIPLLIIAFTAFGLSTSAIDSIEPRSFMESPTKQKTKEMKTPVSNEKSLFKPEKKPEKMGSALSKGLKEVGKRRK